MKERGRMKIFQLNKTRTRSGESRDETDELSRILFMNLVLLIPTENIYKQPK